MGKGGVGNGMERDMFGVIGAHCRAQMMLSCMLEPCIVCEPMSPQQFQLKKIIDLTTNC